MRARQGASTFTTGLVVAAIGAVLYFAINASISGIEIDTVGVIGMVIGALIGLVGVVQMLAGDRSVTEARHEPGRTVVERHDL